MSNLEKQEIESIECEYNLYTCLNLQLNLHLISICETCSEGDNYLCSSSFVKKNQTT